MDERIAHYKAVPLTDESAHDLVIRALDAQIVGPSRIANVVKEWREPSHEEFEPRTAWSLFNAFTEALKSYAPTGRFRRSQPLHGLFDTATRLVDQQPLALAS